MAKFNFESKAVHMYIQARHFCFLNEVAQSCIAKPKLRNYEHLSNREATYFSKTVHMHSGQKNLFQSDQLKWMWALFLKRLSRVKFHFLDVCGLILGSLNDERPEIQKPEVTRPEIGRQRDQCYGSKHIFCKKWRKGWQFLIKLSDFLEKKDYHNIVF
jgi:hypothetical protein